MSDLQIRTQAEVLQWIPQWMWGDFDCPSGAHEWVKLEFTDLIFFWCKHCPKRKREPLSLDDRLALEVIESLTFNAHPGGRT